MVEGVSPVRSAHRSFRPGWALVTHSVKPPDVGWRVCTAQLYTRSAPSLVSDCQCTRTLSWRSWEMVGLLGATGTGEMVRICTSSVQALSGLRRCFWH